MVTQQKSVDYWNARLDQLLTVSETDNDVITADSGLLFPVSLNDNESVSSDVTDGSRDADVSDCVTSLGSHLHHHDVVNDKVEEGSVVDKEFPSCVSVCTDATEAQSILTTRYKLGEINMKRSKSLITWSRWNIAHVIRGPHELSPVWNVKPDDIVEQSVTEMSDEIGRRQEQIADLVRNKQQQQQQQQTTTLYTNTAPRHRQQQQQQQQRRQGNITDRTHYRPATTITPGGVIGGNSNQWQTELAVWIKTQTPTHSYHRNYDVTNIPPAQQQQEQQCIPTTTTTPVTSDETNNTLLNETLLQRVARTVRKITFF